MIDSFATPTGQWGLVFYGAGDASPTHTRQQWAQIAEAIRTADASQTGGIRGDEAWCQAAVAAYQRLCDADAYGRPRQDPTRWYLNEHLVRAWLHAPVIPPDTARPTMLDALGWATRFAPGHTPRPADLAQLIDHAQAVGVVGAPLYRAALLLAVDRSVLRGDAVHVAVYPHDGPGLVSQPVRVDGDLLDAGSSAVDRVVGVLFTVAVIANQLMHSQEARRAGGRDPLAMPHKHQPGTSPRTRPFRVIDGGNKPANPGIPPIPPPTIPRRRRG